jgi:hypothetical protein
MLPAEGDMDDAGAWARLGHGEVLRRARARHARLSADLERRRARCTGLAAKRDRARSPEEAAEYERAHALMEAVTAETAAQLIAAEEALIMLELGDWGGDG